MGPMRPMGISVSCTPLVQSHGDALTNVLRMYHGLLRFLKSWTIGTKDRDSVTVVTVAHNPSTSTVDRRNLAIRGQLQRR